jgi:hypothetical protein
MEEQIRHERDWIFDLSCPVKMNATGFSNYTIAVQSCPVPLKYLVGENMSNMSRMDQ